MNTQMEGFKRTAFSCMNELLELSEVSRIFQISAYLPNFPAVVVKMLQYLLRDHGRGKGSH